MLGDEEAFVGSMQEFIDNFIIGTAAGGQIKFAGSTPGLIRDLAIRNKVKKILEKNGLPSIDAAYNIETPPVEAPDALKFPVINDAQVELSQVPGVKESVDNSVDIKVKKGDLTIQQGNEIKVNFRNTQSAVNQLKPVGLNLNTEAVGLVVEKKKLENIIKEVNDRALTQGQQTRVDEINNRLGDLAAEAQVQAQSIIPGEVVDKAQDLLRKAAGVKTIVDPDLGVTLPTRRTTEIKKGQTKVDQDIDKARAGDVEVQEKDKIVAAWCGRYDDINKTHEQLELIIEWYNAWTIVENNISLFIQYMISRRKQKYLVPKQQILFLKDLGSNRSVFQEYGWKNTGTLFKNHLISYAIEFLREDIDEELDIEGNIISTTKGATRIPDPMLIKEMLAYYPGLNVDRLVAFSALVAFAKIQQSNRGYAKRLEKNENSLDNSKKFHKLKYSPFRNIGRKKTINGQRMKRTGFKNLR